MKHNAMLTIASLLSILFMTFHLTDDIIRGMEKGGVSNLVAVPILVVWLYGTLVLAERRLGYLIILLGSLLGSVVPVIHMMGKGVGDAGNIHTGTEERGLIGHRNQSEKSTVAQAPHPHSLAIDVGKRLQIIGSCVDILRLTAAKITGHAGRPVATVT